MPISTTLRLLAIARGLSSGDIASAIPRAGAATVAAWMRGEKLPGRDQLDALARTFGVPVGALLAELASTFDPSRSKGEHDLLAAFRMLDARQQSALLEVAQSMAPRRPATIDVPTATADAKASTSATPAPAAAAVSARQTRPSRAPAPTKATTRKSSETRTPSPSARRRKPVA